MDIGKKYREIYGYRCETVQFLWIGKTPDTEWDDSDVTGQRKIFRVWIRICFRYLHRKDACDIILVVKKAQQQTQGK